MVAARPGKPAGRQRRRAAALHMAAGARWCEADGGRLRLGGAFPLALGAGRVAQITPSKFAGHDVSCPYKGSGGEPPHSTWRQAPVGARRMAGE